MTITSILCVVDLPAESRGVLRQALTIARQERAWLTVLQVLDPSLMPSARGGHDGRFLEAADKDLLVLIGKASSEAGMDPLAVRRRVRVGAPVQEILAEAEEIDVDLLVMGRDSFNRIEDTEVGHESTAARVLAQSGRPVLLLPPTTQHLARNRSRRRSRTSRPKTRLRQRHRRVRCRSGGAVHDFRHHCSVDFPADEAVDVGCPVNLQSHSVL